jgi:nitrogen regulatory protein PII
MTLVEMKKIEIVAEAIRSRDLCAVLDEAGATGYTVLPVIAGRGHHGMRSTGDPTGLQDTVMIMVIASEPVAQAILARSDRIIGATTAIMAVSTVSVLRADHF